MQTNQAKDTEHTIEDPHLNEIQPSIDPAPGEEKRQSEEPMSEGQTNKNKNANNEPTMITLPKQAAQVQETICKSSCCCCCCYL